MAKKVWDLKHSKIILTSNRREIIVEYKDDESFKCSIWTPMEHGQEVYDDKTDKFKGWNKYITMGVHFVDSDGEECGVLGNIGMFNYLKYWVSHTATLKKIYGYFDENIPTYVLQMLDCYLLDDIDWKPEEYKLSRDPDSVIPEDPRNILYLQKIVY